VSGATAAGTDLYRRMLDLSYPDRERGELMRRVWEPTPFLINVFTGDTGGVRERAILDWCHSTLGDECAPLHGRSGLWQRGCVTIHGWTWYGFATAELKRQFVSRWPSRPAPETSDA
jgi:hypothetical protein